MLLLQVTTPGPHDMTMSEYALARVGCGRLVVSKPTRFESPFHTVLGATGPFAADGLSSGGGRQHFVISEQEKTGEKRAVVEVSFDERSCEFTVADRTGAR